MIERIEASVLETESQPTVQHLLKILTKSFEHSQGSELLHLQLFLSIKAKHPEWRMDDNTAAELLVAANNAFARFIPDKNDAGTLNKKAQYHRAIRKYSRLNNTKDLLGAFQKILNEEAVVQNFSELIPKILLLSLLRDARYLRSKNGRQKVSKNEGKYIPLADPFLSYLCYYGFEQHTTGVPEFDEVYAIASRNFSDDKAFVISLEFGDTARMMLKMIQKYYQKHPQLQKSDYVTDLEERLIKLSRPLNIVRRAFKFGLTNTVSQNMYL